MDTLFKLSCAWKYIIKLPLINFHSYWGGPFRIFVKNISESWGPGKTFLMWLCHLQCWICALMQRRLAVPHSTFLLKLTSLVGRCCCQPTTLKGFHSLAVVVTLYIFISSSLSAISHVAIVYSIRSSTLSSSSSPLSFCETIYASRYSPLALL